MSRQIARAVETDPARVGVYSSRSAESLKTAAAEVAFEDSATGVTLHIVAGQRPFFDRHQAARYDNAS
jgi:hypothetical protein